MKNLEFIQMAGSTLYAKRHPLYAIKSTNSFVRNYKQIMQNKPNFMRFLPENDDIMKKQTQFKANFRKAKMNAFVWISHFFRSHRASSGVIIAPYADSIS